MLIVSELWRIWTNFGNCLEKGGRKGKWDDNQLLYSLSRPKGKMKKLFCKCNPATPKKHDAARLEAMKLVKWIGWAKTRHFYLFRTYSIKKLKKSEKSSISKLWITKYKADPTNRANLNNHFSNLIHKFHYFSSNLIITTFKNSNINISPSIQ